MTSPNGRPLVLDFGCGTGKNTNYLSRWGAVVGVDIGEENIAGARAAYPHIRFLVVRAGELLPFDDETFDEIHTYDVLEHVDDLDGTMHELRRVLKRNGRLVVEVPYAGSEEMMVRLNPSYLEELHHVRVFRGDEMRLLLERFDFAVRSTSRRKFIDNVYFWVLFRFGRHVRSQCGDVAAPWVTAWRNVCLLFSEDLFRKNRYWLYAPVWVFTLPLGAALSRVFPKTIRTVAVRR